MKCDINELIFKASASKIIEGNKIKLDTLQYEHSAHAQLWLTSNSLGAKLNFYHYFYQDYL